MDTTDKQKILELAQKYASNYALWHLVMLDEEASERDRDEATDCKDNARRKLEELLEALS